MSNEFLPVSNFFWIKRATRDLNGEFPPQCKSALQSHTIMLILMDIMSNHVNAT